MFKCRMHDVTMFSFSMNFNPSDSEIQCLLYYCMYITIAENTKLFQAQWPRAIIHII